MKTYREVLPSLLFLLVPLSVSVAQEGASGGKEASAADRGPAAKEYERLLAELTSIVTEMKVLHFEYRDADETRRKEIEEEWVEFGRKGNEVEPKLIEAAQKAFVEAPNADSKLTDLLMDVLEARVRMDDYERALQLGKLLVENKCEDLRSVKFAGIAAFATSDFDNAHKWLMRSLKAQVPIKIDRKSLDNTIKYDFLPAPAKYKDAWANEQKIRRAETEAGDLPEVLLRTSRGDIKLVLFENEAPNTVANFVSLVDQGFYDGLTFHRVIPNFAVQGGCPQGDGFGDPGYHIACECYKPGYRKHFRGSLSMANYGRDTGGSQFFITLVPAPQLDGTDKSEEEPKRHHHTVFGRVVEGLGALSGLEPRDPKPDQPGRPKTKLPDPVKIIEAKVLKRRGHDYVVERIPLKPKVETPSKPKAKK